MQHLFLHRSFLPQKNCLLFTILSLTFFNLSGCNKQPQGARKYPVTGSVSVNGSPANGAVVYFHAVSDELRGRDRNPVGVTDTAGVFQLATSGQNDGAPAGDYIVTIRWPYHPRIPEQDRLRGKYATKSSSDLQVTIGDSETPLPPFRLEVPLQWLVDADKKVNAN